MLGPTPRYRGMKKDPVDGAPIASWSAHPDGYPIRAGDAPVLIEKERLKHAGVVLYMGYAVLDLPKDAERYVEILDWVANGIAELRYEERLRDPNDPRKLIVHICWRAPRGYIPAGNNPPSVSRS